MHLLYDGGENAITVWIIGYSEEPTKETKQCRDSTKT